MPQKNINVVQGQGSLNLGNPFPNGDTTWTRGRFRTVQAKNGEKQHLSPPFLVTGITKRAKLQVLNKDIQSEINVSVPPSPLFSLC